MWRTLFKITFVYILVDGFFTNYFFWFTPVHLVKDILLISTYILFFMNENAFYWFEQFRERIGNGVMIALLAIVGWGVFQIFNPISPGLLRGILGFKVFFLTWGLMLATFAYVTDYEAARKFLRLIAIASVPVCLFGLLQFTKGPEFMVSTFGPGFAGATVIAHVRHVRASESFVRVIGTFASSGMFSNFLIVNTLFSLGLYFTAKTKKTSYIWLGIMVLSFITLLTTGSRGALMTLLLSFGVYALFAGKGVRPVMTIASVIGVVFFAASALLGKNVGARFQSIGEVGMIQERTLGTTPQMFFNFLNEYPMGQGLGAGSTATRYLPGIEGTWELVEAFLPRLQFEMGAVGVLLFFSFVLSLVVRWFHRWMKRSPYPDVNYIMGMCTAYCIVQLLVVTFFGSIENPPTSYFLWAVVGMTARLSFYTDRSLQPQLQSQGSSSPNSS